MSFQLSPGTVITERDLSTIVPAVATTPAGLVGQFKWGPVNQRIIISSENDLYQLFGGPDRITAPYFFSAANFLQYGNNVQVVRGVSGGLNSVAGLTSTTTGRLVANRDAYDASVNNETYSTDSTAFFASRYAGLLGNSLRIEVCDTNGAFNSWSLSGNFNSAPTQTDYVASLGLTGDEIHVAVIDEDGIFSGATGTILELYEGLSKAKDARKSDGSSNYFRNVLNDNSKYVYVLNNINGITTKETEQGGGFGAISSTASAGATTGLYRASFAGGTFGSEMTGAQIAAIYQTQFSNADLVDVSLLIGGPLSGSDAATVAEIAKARMDCVAFFSAPNSNPSSSTLDTDAYAACVSLKNSIGSNSYAVIDSAYKLMYDRYNNTNRWVPLNADIAGLCARTDAVAEPWFSPGGFNRGQIKGVIKLGWNPDKTYRDLIYPKGINPVVTLPGEGTVLYGDRTAQTKPSAFDRINVRRLFIVLEKAMAIAAKYQLFEFNDAFTRSMFVQMVEPYLRDVQARRGVYDYKVICDETNNTPEVIDRNEFVADIYIAPARSINFVRLNFNATRTGVNFEEIASVTRPG